MAIKIYEIKWKLFNSVEEARNSAESREDGIYIFYQIIRGIKKPIYIGKSKEKGRRLGEHEQGLNHFLNGKEKAKCSVCLGTIYKLEGTKAIPIITTTELTHIESFFIIEIPELRNGESTNKVYKGESVIIINTGKFIGFNSVMAHNKTLLSLLTENIKKNKSKTSITKRKPKKPANDGWPF